MERLDHRVRVTRTLIRKAFTDLLAKKPIESISVKELCQAAGINRVQIAVNGSVNVKFRDSISLESPFERNLDYIGGE